MSRAASRYRGAKKTIEKVVHGNYLTTNIPAGMAMAGPPLGPMLGQRNINISQFCKDFNERTKDMKEGIPLPCRITVRADRSYELVIHTPPATFFLKQSAGLTRAAMQTGSEVAGKVSLKHIYEIAKIKSQDPPMECVPLDVICKMMIGIARSCGIQVVPTLEKDEYAAFLADRKLVEEQQLRELEEKRQAKMLRTV